MAIKANIKATMFSLRKEIFLFVHFLHESFLSVRIERHDISSVEKMGLCTCTGGPVWNTTIDRHRAAWNVFITWVIIFISVLIMLRAGQLYKWGMIFVEMSVVNIIVRTVAHVF
jgi:hypothetical protein